MRSLTSKNQIHRTGHFTSVGMRIGFVWMFCIALGGLHPGANDAEAFEVEIERFIVDGENPLKGFKTVRVLKPYLGKHTDLERLEEAPRALEQTLRDEGYTFYRVLLPAQNFEDKNFRLEVRSLKIVELSVEGIDHFTEQNIRRSMPGLRIGSSPNIQRLGRALAEANRHPSKNLKLTFAVLAEAGGLKARLSTVDQKPSTVFGWLDNSGTKRTGRYRVGLGFQHTNLFGRDHTVTVTGTAAPDQAADVHQIGLQYRVPIYRLGSDIELIAADSSVDSATFEGEAFDVSGAGEVLGVRLRKGLPRIGQYRHDLILSVFDKHFENETRFVGNSVLDSTVTSRPIGLEYRAALQGQRLNSNWYIGHYQNLSDWGDENVDENYNDVRLGARADWSSTRVGGAIGYRLGKWSLRGKLDGQTSSDLLIAGEQFTFGGMRSVRGFGESEFAEDRGLQATLEVWTPQWGQGLQLLGFVDYGYGRRVAEEGSSEKSSLEIGSLGIGMRWAWHQRLRARLDYGYVFEAPLPLNDDATEQGDSKVHASFIYLF